MLYKKRRMFVWLYGRIGAERKIMGWPNWRSQKNNMNWKKNKSENYGQTRDSISEPNSDNHDLSSLNKSGNQ